jgi:hypothetical protein
VPAAPQRKLCRYRLVHALLMPSRRRLEELRNAAQAAPATPAASPVPGDALAADGTARERRPALTSCEN